MEFAEGRQSVLGRASTLQTAEVVLAHSSISSQTMHVDSSERYQTHRTAVTAAATAALRPVNRCTAIAASALPAWPESTTGNPTPGGAALPASSLAGSVSACGMPAAASSCTYASSSCSSEPRLVQTQYRRAMRPFKKRWSVPPRQKACPCPRLTPPRPRSPPRCSRSEHAID